MTSLFAALPFVRFWALPPSGSFSKLTMSAVPHVILDLAAAQAEVFEHGKSAEGSTVCGAIED